MELFWANTYSYIYIPILLKLFLPDSFKIFVLDQHPSIYMMMDENFQIARRQIRETAVELRESIKALLRYPYFLFLNTRAVFWIAIGSDSLALLKGVMV